ncbi:MAG: GNAT family N-acetyltransferase [Spirosomataceae bacterium]
MNKEKIVISTVAVNKEIPYDLLLLSDDTIEAINKNLHQGELFTAKIDNEIIGAFILKMIDKDFIEIKNIAVPENQQGKGIGTVLLENIIQISIKRKFKNLVVGTCDLCKKEIKFYKKSGFEISGIRKNFFIDNYEAPIYENGEQIKDMVMLSIDLRSNRVKSNEPSASYRQ